MYNLKNFLRQFSDNKGKKVSNYRKSYKTIAGEYKKKNYSRGLNIRSGGLIGVDVKNLDCEFANKTVASTANSSRVDPTNGCTGCISLPAQGDAVNERLGQKYTITSVYASGLLDPDGSYNGATIAQPAGVYVCLVLDKQANGTSASGGDIWQEPTDSRMLLPQPLRLLANTTRFKILTHQFVEQKSLTITGGATSGYTATQPVLNWTLSWKGKIRCSAVNTGADVANAKDNALHLFAITTSGYTWRLYGKSRVRFIG